VTPRFVHHPENHFVDVNKMVYVSELSIGGVVKGTDLVGTLSAAGGVSYLSSACTMQNPFVIRARMSAYDDLRCGRGDPLFNTTFLVAPLVIDGASVIHLKDVTVTCPLSAPSKREGEQNYSTVFTSYM